MSSGQTMVVLIVLIVSIAGIVRARFLAQHGIFERRHGRAQFITPPQDEAAKVEMQREIETLRERIKVLERIATDTHKPSLLANEIESLRDR